MCNDFANLQNILDKRNDEINILRSDIANLIEENNMHKQDKSKLELNVSILNLNFN